MAAGGEKKIRGSGAWLPGNSETVQAAEAAGHDMAAGGEKKSGVLGPLEGILGKLGNSSSDRSLAKAPEPES